jgi:hypothetical protein
VAKQRMKKLHYLTKDGRLITSDDAPLVPDGLAVPGPLHKKLAKKLVRLLAERALDDPEELDRQAAELLERLPYATMGQKLSDAGKKSPGRRGRYKTPRNQLRAAVLEMHKRFPGLTFNDVCNRIGERFGYQSGWSAKQAARDLQWHNPHKKKNKNPT